MQQPHCCWKGVGGGGFWGGAGRWEVESQRGQLLLQVLCSNIENCVCGRNIFVALRCKQKIFDTFFNMRNAFYAAKCFQLSIDTAPQQYSNTATQHHSSRAIHTDFGHSFGSCRSGVTDKFLWYVRIVELGSMLSAWGACVASLKRQLKRLSRRDCGAAVPWSSTLVAIRSNKFESHLNANPAAHKWSRKNSMEKCEAQSARCFAHSAGLAVEIFHVNQSDMPFLCLPRGFSFSKYIGPVAEWRAVVWLHLHAGGSLLAPGFWLLAPGCWLLASGRGAFGMPATSEA